MVEHATPAKRSQQQAMEELVKDALVDKHDADQPVLIVRVAEIVVLHDRSTSPYAIGCGVTLSEVTERLFVDLVRISVCGSAKQH